MPEYDGLDVLLGRSRARRRILTLLLERPGGRLHLRGIARAVGTSAGTASRELGRLEATGLVRRRRDGAQVYFEADVASPLAEPVRSLLRQAPLDTRSSTGDPVGRAIAAQLSARLPAVYDDRLRGVYLYGSRARGDHQPDSDVDILIVLDRIEDYGSDLRRSSEIASDVSLEQGLTVTRMLVSEADWDARQRPILRSLAQDVIRG
jgi:DNA-binding transcriptional ArsR family regulator